MHPPKGISTTSKPDVLLPGYQGGTVTEDPGFCTSLTVLSGEVQPADARPTTPFGEVHVRTTEGDWNPGTLCGDTSLFYN